MSAYHDLQIILMYCPKKIGNYLIFNIFYMLRIIIYLYTKLFATEDHPKGQNYPQLLNICGIINIL